MFGLVSVADLIRRHVVLICLDNAVKSDPPSSPSYPICRTDVRRCLCNLSLLCRASVRTSRSEITTHDSYHLTSSVITVDGMSATGIPKA